jgi:hypothetical protein
MHVRFRHWDTVVHENIHNARSNYWDKANDERKKQKKKNRQLRPSEPIDINSNRVY